MNRVYDQIYAIVYGHCVGDAIGLLTETLTKEEAKKVKYALKLKKKSCKTFKPAERFVDIHITEEALHFNKCCKTNMMQTVVQSCNIDLYCSFYLKCLI